METIKVKRSPESKGRCKLAWNKAYKAKEHKSVTFGDGFIIGANFYPKSWFTHVTDNQPKSKPVVTTDPKTGKLKVERDWSVHQAFPVGYVIKNKCRAIKVGETLGWIKKGAIGTIVPDGSRSPKFVCDDKEMYPDSCEFNKDGVFEYIHELAPLNPTDHPEHPDFGKAKAQPEIIQITPEPTDIRDTIADYIKKYGHELTATELIGHLTIDMR